MTAQIIDGRALAARLNDASKKQVEALHRKGVEPRLAVVLVGDDPASHAYVRNKHKTCHEVGIKTLDIQKPSTLTQAELIAIVEDLNRSPTVHGILVQLPLPLGLDAEAVFRHINPTKDVDGFHPINVGKVVKGDPTGMVPCTPQGAVHLIESVVPDTTGLHAVIVGRSHLVGKPLIQLLLKKNMTVTVAHSQTKDLKNVCRGADVLVAAAGSPGLITMDHVKPQAVVIDVGINKVGSQLVGDVDFDAVKRVARAITPVPGGVGPMTIACLIQNTLKAADIKQ